VHAERESAELENEMLAPGEDVLHLLARQPLDSNLAVAGNTRDAPADKRLKLFGSKVE
jgi:hypothetical protein